MTEAQLAWVAGLLEGEGSFYTVCRKRRYQYAAIACTMTDEDVIRELHKTVGAGNIHGPYQRAMDRLPVWRWQLQRTEPAQALMRALIPHMGKRRRQRIREVLRQCSR